LPAARVGAAVELGPAVAHQSLDIMTGRNGVGAKFARERDEVGELDPLIARRARHRRSAARIFVGEGVDHLPAKAAFIIEHIMRDAETLGDLLGIVNVLPGAARTRPLHRRAMVIELERDADHFGAAALGKRGRDRAVDAARHGDDDSRRSAPRARRPLKFEVQLHRLTHGVAALYPNFTPAA